MENINVNQEVVETVVEETGKIDWKEVGKLGGAFLLAAGAVYGGIKLLKHIKAKKNETKVHEIEVEETDVTNENNED